MVNPAAIGISVDGPLEDADNQLQVDSKADEEEAERTMQADEEEIDEYQPNCIVLTFLYVRYLVVSQCKRVVGFFLLLLKLALTCVEDVNRHCYSKNLISIFLAAICIGAIPIFFLISNDDYYLGASKAEAGLPVNTVAPQFTEVNMQPALIFEMNRHGARAPYLREAAGLDGFSVAREMLTPVGMRQRSLLGRA